MSSAYHPSSSWSGDIAGPHDRELHVAHPSTVPQGGLTMEQVSDALVAQASEGTTRCQVLAVTSTDLADHASPSAAMADSGSLVTEIAVSHFSLSPLEREPLGK
jgi:hypothetical protein